jgi:O-antigen/teichoic acid export membrane protein
MLLGETAVYFWARGVPAAINFLALAYFTRVLEPQEYGIYALVMAWVLIGNTMLFQWLRLAMVRVLPASVNPSGLLSTVLSAHISVITVVLVIGLTLATLAPSFEVRLQVAIGTVLVCTLAWFELNTERLRAELRARRYAAMSIAKAVGGFAIGALLVSLGYGGLGVLTGVTLATVLTPFVVGTGSWRAIGVRRADAVLLARLAHYGFPLSLSLALMFLVGAFDRVIISWLLDTEAVGLYAAGYDLAQLTIGVLIGIVSLAGVPRIAKALDSSGPIAAQKEARQCGILMLHIALPVTAFFAILSATLSAQLLGVRFSQAAANIIPFIALAALFGGLKAYYLDLAFQLSQRTYPQLGIAACIAVTSIGLNFLLIPAMGLSGAAVSSFVSFAFGALLSALIGRHYFPVPLIDREFVKALVATMLMCAVLWQVRDVDGWGGLGWQVLLATFSYSLGFVLLDCVGIRNRFRAAWFVN